MENVDYIEKIMASPTSKSQNPPLFTILDGARNQKIVPMVEASYNEHCCLFMGNLDRELIGVAPHLMRLTHETRFTRSVIKNGWSDFWGIFFSSSADIDDLRRHFRHFLFVREEKGKRLFFRFYDPRVLKIFLPTCTVEEAKEFFGPVDRFIIPGDHPKEVMVYSVSEKGVKVEKKHPELVH